MQDDDIDQYPKDPRVFKTRASTVASKRALSTIVTAFPKERKPALPDAKFPVLTRRWVSLDEEQLRDALEESSATPTFHFWQLSRRNKVILLSLGLSDFCIYLCLGIFAPFFPLEVNKRGLPTSFTGFVFAVYGMTFFCVSPLFGRYMGKIGVNFSFLSGLFVCAGTTAVFGFLDQLPNNIHFISFCFVTRIIEAIGASAVATASVVIVADVFPDHVVPCFGILEMFVGLGMCLGPAIGGGLYGLGGYILPFLVLSALLFLSTIIMYMTIPFVKCHPLPPASYSGVLRIPKALIVCYHIFVVSMVWSFFDPILEPYLRTLNLGPSIVGVLFLVLAVAYTATSPFWGYLGDRVECNGLMMGFGMMGCGAALFVMGPSPWIEFLGLPTSLWLTIVCLIVFGIAASAAIIPSFDALLAVAIEETEMEYNYQTYALVSGLWTTFYALGEVAGPLVGSFLFDHLKFAYASTIMAVLCFSSVLALIGLSIVQIIVRKIRIQRFITHGLPDESWAQSSSSSSDESFSARSEGNYGSLGGMEPPTWLEDVIARFRVSPTRRDEEARDTILSSSRSLTGGVEPMESRRFTQSTN